MDSFESLFNEYIKSRSVFKTSRSHKPFVIGFIALNGTGKSFLSKLISQRFGNIPISCNDYIRRFLESKGLSSEGGRDSPLHYLAVKESEYFYQNRISHIIDADLIKWYQDTEKAAKSYGFYFIMIQLICPENIVINRLKNRLKEVRIDPAANYSRVGPKEYYHRQKLHLQLGLPQNFYETIDSSLDLESQISHLENKMKSDGYL